MTDRVKQEFNLAFKILIFWLLCLNFSNLFFNFRVMQNIGIRQSRNVGFFSCSLNFSIKTFGQIFHPRRLGCLFRIPELKYSSFCNFTIFFVVTLDFAPILVFLCQILTILVIRRQNLSSACFCCSKKLGFVKYRQFSGK